MIRIEFDEQKYPQFMEAFKARYDVDTEEEALIRLEKEIIELYTYGLQALFLKKLNK